MKLKFKPLILGIATTLLLASCGDNKKPGLEAIYRSKEEWKERWSVPVYHENKEIKGMATYDHSLAVKCTNGTFVGQRLENNKIKTWRGIPFAKIDARFEKAKQPDASDKVYEALYFGKSCLQQPNSESEPASFYQMGDLDTLTLVIATGNNTNANKPVFVYMHGGAYSCGGTTDPAYDLRNLAYYYPDVIFVDMTYRLGIQGHIDLGIKDEFGDYIFSDYEENEAKYNASNNLAILDAIESLRWVKQNIAGFGGDVNNITIGGESAGGGLVSSLLMIASDPNNNNIRNDEKLFHKVFSMSGGINQYGKVRDNDVLTKQLLEYYEWKYESPADSIEDIQEMPFEDLFEFWNGSPIDAPKKWENKGSDATCGNYLDGVVLPDNIDEAYRIYNKYVDGTYKVLQGATTNEYDYFKKVFKDTYEAGQFTHEDCCLATLKYLTEPSEAYPDLEVTPEFLADLDVYFEELKREGFDTEAKRLNELLSDQFLQTINYYMAQKQAANGGKTYCYAFGQPYDGEYSVCKAGHAVDVYYFFGSFNGGKAEGTKAQVDLSRKYQEMAVNFIRNGTPSMDGFTWEEYNKENGYITYLSVDRLECVKGYNKDRINAACRMYDENEAMRTAFGWSLMFKMAKEIHKGN